jgi:hypothetical protein
MNFRRTQTPPQSACDEMEKTRRETQEKCEELRESCITCKSDAGNMPLVGHKAEANFQKLIIPSKEGMMTF